MEVGGVRFDFAFDQGMAGLAIKVVVGFALTDRIEDGRKSVGETPSSRTPSESDSAANC